jgi:hypothetical protein
MHDRLTKGGKVIICRFYADIPAQTEGTILKFWTVKKTTWVKVFFGFNLSGQKLTKSFPADCIEIKTT